MSICEIRRNGQVAHCKNNARLVLGFLLLVFVAVEARNRTSAFQCARDGISIAGFCQNGGSCQPVIPVVKNNAVVGMRCFCGKYATGSRCETVISEENKDDTKRSSRCDKNPCKYGGQCLLKSETNVTKEAAKWTDLSSDYWCNCSTAKYKKSGKVEGKHCENYIPFTGKCKHFCTHGKCRTHDTLGAPVLQKYDDGKRCTCDFGYQGDRCKAKCELGSFGLYCLDLCSLGCEEKCPNRKRKLGWDSGRSCSAECAKCGPQCNFKTGKCKCKIGWTGKQCDIYLEFIPGCSEQNKTLSNKGNSVNSDNSDGNSDDGSSEGSDQVQEVPANCLNGKCAALKRGSVLQYCKCTLGFNGTNCQSNCSLFDTYGKWCGEHCGHCANGACNNKNGLCPKVKGEPTCKEPYFGKKCQRSKDWAIDGIYKLKSRLDPLANSNKKLTAVETIQLLQRSEVNADNKRRLERALKILYGKRARADIVSELWLGSLRRSNPSQSTTPRTTVEETTTSQEQTSPRLDAIDEEDDYDNDGIVKRQASPHLNVIIEEHDGNDGVFKRQADSSSGPRIDVQFNAFIPADEIGLGTDVREQVVAGIIENADEFESDLFQLDPNSVVVNKATLLAGDLDDESASSVVKTEDKTLIDEEVAIIVLSIGTVSFIIATICTILFIKRRQTTQFALDRKSGTSSRARKN